jgi:Cu-Zn family superoxide dismutase
MKNGNSTITRVRVALSALFAMALVVTAGQALAQETEPSRAEAIVVLMPTEGNDVAGTVTFTEVEGGVQVTADVTGLAPGDHGFHVHQLGDCSAPDGTSAGGHFNPMGMEHGGPDADVRHVGDLGNITADESGHATYSRVDPMLSLSGETSIIGRAVIIHAGTDDLTSQPTGAAGARLACGVIGIKAQ